MFQFELKYWFTTICSGWATGDDIGSDDEALTKDYLSSKVWDDPANYIAIVRHQNGVVDATKVFQFKNSYAGTSLHTRFVFPFLKRNRDWFLDFIIGLVIKIGGFDFCQ